MCCLLPQQLPLPKPLLLHSMRATLLGSISATADCTRITSITNLSLKTKSLSRKSDHQDTNENLQCFRLCTRLALWGQRPSYNCFSRHRLPQRHLLRCWPDLHEQRYRSRHAGKINQYVGSCYLVHDTFPLSTRARPSRTPSAAWTLVSLAPNPPPALKS